MSLFEETCVASPPAREAKPAKRASLPDRTGVAWPVRGEVRPTPVLAAELAGLDRMRAAGDADGVRWCLVALLFWLDGEPLAEVARVVERHLRRAA